MDAGTFQPFDVRANARSAPPMIVYVGPDAEVIAREVHRTAPHLASLVSEDPGQALRLIEGHPVHAVVSSLEGQAARRFFAATSARHPRVVRILISRPGAPSVDAWVAASLATVTIRAQAAGEIPRIVACVRER